MTQKFISFVESNDLINVRLSLSNELLLNPNGNSFHIMKEYAEKKLPDLYEEHTGELSKKDVNTFTKTDIINLKTELDYNFSKERLTLLETAVHAVLKDKPSVNNREEQKDEGTNSAINVKNICKKAAIPAIGFIVGYVIKGLKGAVIGSGIAIAVNHLLNKENKYKEPKK